MGTYIFKFSGVFAGFDEDYLNDSNQPTPRQAELPAAAQSGLAFFISIIVINVIPHIELKFAGVEDFMFARLERAVYRLRSQFSVPIVYIGNYRIFRIDRFSAWFWNVQNLRPEKQCSHAGYRRSVKRDVPADFFSSNGHLTFMRIIASSFDIFPVGTQLFNPEFGRFLVDLFGNILVLAIKLALPVIAVG